MARIEIRNEWCKGCYICVDVCPKSVFEVSTGEWLKGFHPVRVARPEECTVCRNCELLCPDLAIVVVPDEQEGQQ